jgi:hypothetical protein
VRRLRSGVCSAALRRARPSRGSYLLLELLWRDGRVDDTLGAPRNASSCLVAACRTCCAALTHVRCSGASELLAAIRESLQLNFGDAALGAALASLQGARSPHDSACRRSAPRPRGL